MSRIYQCLGLLLPSRFSTKPYVSNLAVDKFDDAANPYGKLVSAFAIVEGWQTRYLLFLIGLGLFVSVLVVSIATIASRSLETGLTAGSYALGVVTLLLATMTLASAIV